MASSGSHLQVTDALPPKSPLNFQRRPSLSTVLTYVRAGEHQKLRDLLSLHSIDLDPPSGVSQRIYDNLSIPNCVTIACQYGCIQILETLIKHGANIHAHSLYDNQITPIYTAALHGHFDIVTLLAFHYHVPHCSTERQYPNLIFAMLNGYRNWALYNSSSVRIKTVPKPEPERVTKFKKMTIQLIDMICFLLRRHYLNIKSRDMDGKSVYDLVCDIFGTDMRLFLVVYLSKVSGLPPEHITNAMTGNILEQSSGLGSCMDLILNPNISIVPDTPSCQELKDKYTGIFYKIGSYDNISVTQLLVDVYTILMTIFGPTSPFYNSSRGFPILNNTLNINTGVKSSSDEENMGSIIGAILHCDQFGQSMTPPTQTPSTISRSIYQHNDDTTMNDLQTTLLPCPTGLGEPQLSNNNANIQAPTSTQESSSDSSEDVYDSSLFKADSLEYFRSLAAQLVLAPSVPLQIALDEATKLQQFLHTQPWGCFYASSIIPSIPRQGVSPSSFAHPDDTPCISPQAGLTIPTRSTIVHSIIAAQQYVYHGWYDHNLLTPHPLPSYQQCPIILCEPYMTFHALDTICSFVSQTQDIPTQPEFSADTAQLIMENLSTLISPDIFDLYTTIHCLQVFTNALASSTAINSASKYAYDEEEYSGNEEESMSTSRAESSQETLASDVVYGSDIMGAKLLISRAIYYKSTTQEECESDESHYLASLANLAGLRDCLNTVMQEWSSIDLTIIPLRPNILLEKLLSMDAYIKLKIKIALQAQQKYYAIHQKHLRQKHGIQSTEEESSDENEYMNEYKLTLADIDIPLLLQDLDDSICSLSFCSSRVCRLIQAIVRLAGFDAHGYAPVRQRYLPINAFDMEHLFNKYGRDYMTSLAPLTFSPPFFSSIINPLTTFMVYNYPQEYIFSLYYTYDWCKGCKHEICRCHVRPSSAANASTENAFSRGRQTLKTRTNRHEISFYLNTYDSTPDLGHWRGNFKEYRHFCQAVEKEGISPVSIGLIRNIDDEPQFICEYTECVDNLGAVAQYMLPRKSLCLTSLFPHLTINPNDRYIFNIVSSIAMSPNIFLLLFHTTSFFIRQNVHQITLGNTDDVGSMNRAFNLHRMLVSMRHFHKMSTEDQKSLSNQTNTSQSDYLNPLIHPSPLKPSFGAVSQPISTFPVVDLLLSRMDDTIQGDCPTLQHQLSTGPLDSQLDKSIALAPPQTRDWTNFYRPFLPPTPIFPLPTTFGDNSIFQALHVSYPNLRHLLNLAYNGHDLYTAQYNTSLCFFFNNSHFYVNLACAFVLLFKAYIVKLTNPTLTDQVTPISTPLVTQSPMWLLPSEDKTVHVLYIIATIFGIDLHNLAQCNDCRRPSVFESLYRRKPSRRAPCSIPNNSIFMASPSQSPFNSQSLSESNDLSQSPKPPISTDNKSLFSYILKNIVHNDIYKFRIIVLSLMFCVQYSFINGFDIKFSLSMCPFVPKTASNTPVQKATTASPICTTDFALRPDSGSAPSQSSTHSGIISQLNKESYWMWNNDEKVMVSDSEDGPHPYDDIGPLDTQADITISFNNTTNQIRCCQEAPSSPSISAHVEPVPECILSSLPSPPEKGSESYDSLYLCLLLFNMIDLIEDYIKTVKPTSIDSPLLWFINWRLKNSSQNSLLSRKKFDNIPTPWYNRTSSKSSSQSSNEMKSKRKKTVKTSTKNGQPFDSIKSQQDSIIVPGASPCILPQSTPLPTNGCFHPDNRPEHRGHSSHLVKSLILEPVPLCLSREQDNTTLAHKKYRETNKCGTTTSACLLRAPSPQLSQDQPTLTPASSYMKSSTSIASTCSLEKDYIHHRHLNITPPHYINTLSNPVNEANTRSNPPLLGHRSLSGIRTPNVSLEPVLSLQVDEEKAFLMEHKQNDSELLNNQLKQKNIHPHQGYPKLETPIQTSHKPSPNQQRMPSSHKLTLTPPIASLVNPSLVPPRREEIPQLSLEGFIKSKESDLPGLSPNNSVLIRKGVLTLNYFMAECALLLGADVKRSVIISKGDITTPSSLILKLLAEHPMWPSVFQYLVHSTPLNSSPDQSSIHGLDSTLFLESTATPSEILAAPGNERSKMVFQAIRHLIVNTLNVLNKHSD